jgi:hypothetical protein
LKRQQHFDGEGNVLDKSYDSMGSQDKDPLHYEIDSDNEPPKDEIGDMLTVVKKGQVTKEILEVRTLNKSALGILFLCLFVC